MIVTKAQLKACMPLVTAENLEKFTDPLNETLERYDIKSPQRLSCFIAQIAHESGSLRYVRELATGEAYEGRLSLGNRFPGDGRKYKGRGLIQITGRTNYQNLSNSFGVDFINNPTLLEGPLYASLSAGWFWDLRKLNELADVMDFKKITLRINGGYNGYEDRLKYFEYCKQTFGI